MKYRIVKKKTGWAVQEGFLVFWTLQGGFPTFGDAKSWLNANVGLDKDK